MNSLRQLEAAWIASLQALGGDPWLTWLMKGCSVLGLEFFYGVAVILLLGWDRRVGTRFCCLFFAAAAVSELLKLAGHGPRPYWINPLVINFTAPNFSFGMPSGHTFYATCGWLFLAGLAPVHWKWAKPLAWLMIALVGFSRVWLGVHFISDVVGGLVAGWFYLKLFLVVERLYGDTLERLELRQQLMIATAAAGFTHALGRALRTGGLAAARAADWAPVYLDRVRWDAVGPAGLLFGFITALALARRWARYEVPPSWWHRGFCILVGGAGLAAFHYGLKVPKSLAGTSWDQMAVFFRYALMMVWMIFVTPLICLRLGWAVPARTELAPTR